ncbi:MAG: MCE family protein [Actinobacteria bacterium]|nr:MCE family protein [Actinomycetota bacterium]
MSRALFKTRRRLIGIVMLVVFGLLIWLSIGVYNKQFSSATMVTLDTGSAGNEMNFGAEVMVRGVVVGDVRGITSAGTGARLDLALQPGVASQLPANVHAVLLPTTLFGQRYVQLILPAEPSAQTLAYGGVISEDRSRDAIELQKVLNDLLPMLTQVQPQKLSVTLSAMATALNENGARLGQTLDAINSYLKSFNPYLPTLDTDIARLAQVTQTYSQAAPGIVAALRNFSVTSRTVASEATNLRSVYSTVTGASERLTTFVQQNQGTIISLSANSVQTLQILSRYSAEFPCVFTDLTKLIPNMNKALGAGTKFPGLHITVHPVEPLGSYRAAVDTPKYGDNRGPHCYPLPFRGIAMKDGASPPNATARTTQSSAASGSGQAAGPTLTGSIPVPAAGLGLPNSPAENELISELLSPTLNIPPNELPSWSSVLTGPLFRGTEVTVK